MGLENPQHHPSDEEFQARYHTQKGEEHKNRGAWENALSEFKRALKLSPGSSDILVRIAQVYESKGTQENEPAFLKLAWHHYQDAITRDGSNAKAHDHLIALAVKMRRFDELITNYKRWISQDAGNALLPSCLKKLQTLSLMSIPDVSGQSLSKRGIMAKFFLDIMIPFSSVLLLLLGYMVKNYYSQSKLAPYTSPLIVSGWVGLGCFALYKFLTFQSAANQRKRWS